MGTSYNKVTTVGMDTLIILPVSILLINVMVPSKLAGLVSHSMHTLHRLKELVMWRSSGLLKTSAAQLMFPVCRVARQLPHLSISRLLLSVVDFDVRFIMNEGERYTLAAMKADWVLWYISMIPCQVLNVVIAVLVICAAYALLLAACVIELISAGYVVLFIVGLAVASFLLVNRLSARTKTKVSNIDVASSFLDMPDGPDHSTLRATSKSRNSILKLKKYLTRKHKKVSVLPVSLSVKIPAKSIIEDAFNAGIEESKQAHEYQVSVRHSGLLQPKPPIKVRKYTRKSIVKDFGPTDDFSHIATRDLFSDPHESLQSAAFGDNMYDEINAWDSPQHKIVGGSIYSNAVTAFSTSNLVMSPNPVHSTESNGFSASRRGKIYLPKISATRQSAVKLRESRAAAAVAASGAETVIPVASASDLFAIAPSASLSLPSRPRNAFDSTESLLGADLFSAANVSVKSIKDVHTEAKSQAAAGSSRKAGRASRKNRRPYNDDEVTLQVLQEPQLGAGPQADTSEAAVVASGVVPEHVDTAIRVIESPLLKLRSSFSTYNKVDSAGRLPIFTAPLRLASDTRPYLRNTGQFGANPGFNNTHNVSRAVYTTTQMNTTLQAKEEDEEEVRVVISRPDDLVDVSPKYNSELYATAQIPANTITEASTAHNMHSYDDDDLYNFGTGDNLC
jgi:hypothetical protein